MDPSPTPLNAQADNASRLDDFRLSTPAEVMALLRDLQDSHVLVNLNGSDGAVYTTTLWAIDPARATLSFSADAESAHVQALVESEDVVAVAYLDSVKLQFDITGLVTVHSEDGRALNCDFPKEVFRFQRRSSFRVRPLMRSSPVARFRHPNIPDMPLALRVLDVSIGGLALFLPEDVPPLQPGVLMNGVQIDLDVETRVLASLRLQHVTSVNPDARGVRLGFEMVSLSGDVMRNLQRYIDQTQKRQRLLSL